MKEVPLDAVIERITQLALKQFVVALCDNRDHSWNPDHGTAPSKAYVERKEFATEPWSPKSTIAAWSIDDYCSIVEIAPIENLDRPTVDGMFFDTLYGYWGVSVDWKRISINWQTGPRFGRGFVYPILESPTGILYLGDRVTTWVS